MEVTTNQIAEVLEGQIKNFKVKDRKFHEECELKYKDNFADVRIIIDNDKQVTVTYDGAGYDFLSVESYVENPFTGGGCCPSDSYRASIDAALKELDSNLYSEDNNSWSFSVYL